MKKVVICLFILFLIPSMIFGADVYKYKIVKVERGDSSLSIDISVFVNNGSRVDFTVNIDPTVLAALTTKTERIAFVKQQIEIAIKRYRDGVINKKEMKEYEGAEVTIP